MSTTAYIDHLKQLRTYKVGLIKDKDIQTCQLNWHWSRLFRTPPTWPRANDDRHVVVITVQDDKARETNVLSTHYQVINPFIQDVDKLVFVFLNVKREKIKIEPPVGGYRLADDQEVTVDFDLTIQITDTEKFWYVADDQIALLESEIVNETRKYFLNITRSHLTTIPPIAEQEQEQQRLASPLSVTLQGLEAQIRKISFPGVQIHRVDTQIKLSNQP